MCEEFVQNSVILTESVVQNRFVRERDHSVFTKMCTKDYKIVYDKHRILKDYFTVPYGY